MPISRNRFEKSARPELGKFPASSTQGNPAPWDHHPASFARHRTWSCTPSAERSGHKRKQRLSRPWNQWRMLNYCKFLRPIDVAGATVSIFETALYGFAVAVAGRQLCGYLHHSLRLCFAMVSRSIPIFHDKRNPKLGCNCGRHGTTRRNRQSDVPSRKSHGRGQG